jgi:hypothetical protein
MSDIARPSSHSDRKRNGTFTAESPGAISHSSLVCSSNDADIQDLPLYGEQGNHTCSAMQATT